MLLTEYLKHRNKDLKVITDAEAKAIGLPDMSKGWPARYGSWRVPDRLALAVKTYTDKHTRDKRRNLKTVALSIRPSERYAKPKLLAFVENIDVSFALEALWSSNPILDDMNARYADIMSDDRK